MNEILSQARALDRLLHADGLAGFFLPHDTPSETYHWESPPKPDPEPEQEDLEEDESEAPTPDDNHRPPPPQRTVVIQKVVTRIRCQYCKTFCNFEDPKCASCGGPPI